MLQQQTTRNTSMKSPVPIAGKTIEEKYRKLSDIEHCLERPGMYVGSTKPREEELYLLNAEDKFELRKVTYNPAFLKIFDEIVSNSIDEHRRNPKLNEVKVTVDQEKGTIVIWDNGGIPVVKHAQYDEWVPEMIFSNLKAGSNFNDDEERLVAGTNGVGSTLTNIFSLKFRVRTADRKHAFQQTFSNNMRERTPPKVLEWKEGFTEIMFQPDLVRFGMEGIDDVHLELMRKRCIDLAACNPGLKMSFNGAERKFKSFADYSRMYTDLVVFEDAHRWRIGVAPSPGGFTQVSFVNAVETKDGGTHVDYVMQQISDWLRERVKKKHKLELRPAELRNHFMLFIQADIVNPAFSSQTKEKLITESRDFGSQFKLSEKALKSIFDSEIIQRILDWAQQKALADERKQLRELNKSLSKEKVLKLVDAKGKDREKCTLGLFEGDSAMSFFRKFRDPSFQGAFPLRGKFINVTELPNTRVIQNQEVKDLLTAIGLKMGEPPKDLRYGKILIYSDADVDGDSIAGLLMNFFGRYWPELFEQERICRVMTPLVVAKRKGETLPFYSAADFDEWQRKQKDLTKWDIAYKKGLAALEDEEAKEIIVNPKMFSIAGGSGLKPTLDAWFASDPAIRKLKILGEPTESSEDNT
jgi:DNA topoisomerase-2